MKDGVIQQCGAPLEVYHRPINRFVAGFVGSPPMNFFEGVVAKSEGKLWFDEGTGRLAIPGWAQGALGSRVGSKVVMGARPQAMRDEPSGSEPGRDDTLPMTVRVVEPLGDKMDVYLSTENHPHVIARVDAHRDLLPNERTSVRFDLDRVHFFELGEPGRALATAPAPS
jgi:multiple sugar transport system ATP-binding protein